VTETEIIDYLSALSGVVAFTASEEGGSPASAWGDTFFFYDPEGNLPDNQRLPFATLVIHDYAGWDTDSKLDRDGIFRVNVAVGRSSFERLLDYPPSTQATHHDEFDYAATDVLLPHPIYASQGWISILNPADQTSAQLRGLLDEAHGLAVRRYARRQDARREATEPSDPSGDPVAELNTEVKRLLDRPNYAHLASLLPDGAPHSVPVWIDREGQDVVILTGPGSRKARNLERDPRVAISLIDVDQPYASVLIRGRVVERIDGDRGWQIIDRIARKYTGQPYPLRSDRIVLLIKPEHADAVIFG
jgi:PPOX class probable F420-dependent enzyme